MFDRIKKDDLVGYSEHPRSIPLGVVKEVKEHKGKAVVMVHLFDVLDPEDFGMLKCVPYHKLERIASASYLEKEND